MSDTVGKRESDLGSGHDSKRTVGEPSDVCSEITSLRPNSSLVPGETRTFMEHTPVVPCDLSTPPRGQDPTPRPGLRRDRRSGEGTLVKE